MADTKYIIRIAQTDLDGKKHIFIAMTKIKGVSTMLANALCGAVGIDKTKKAGNLTEQEIKKLEDALKNPAKYSLPSWLFNRRNDYETGEDKHLITADLAYTKENDIKRLRKSKSYIGMRHSWGLTVRGQKTKSNFRKNRGQTKSRK